MAQVTRCPHCSTTLQLPADSAGKPIRCPICKQLIAVKPTVAVMPPAAPPSGLAQPPAPKSSNPSVAPPAPSPSPPAQKNGTGSFQAPRAPVGRAPQSSPTPPPATKPPPAPSTCPACQAWVRPGFVACSECGFLLQADSTTVDTEASPNLCPNPACGVANGQGERTCQRCGSPLPVPAGTMLHGHYRIEKLLAIGGFSAVYLATDMRAGNRLVALKDMICNEPQEFSIRLNFFQREAEILRSLDKVAAVPRFYDYFEEGQTAHLVLEYIQGQDLLKVLEANGNKPFQIDQVINWGKSICEVLSHMHMQAPPVVHRDVKPENIMLTDDQRSIRMIDFGTARDMGRAHQTKPAAMTRVYTEGYAPPEQIIGKPEPRSDLFALAGTLYHLATGKAPDFHTGRELENQLADPKGSITPEHRWFYELLKINLADDVNERYFSCREFRGDLERRQVTREVLCPKCQDRNPVRQPYCRKCAAPLTDGMPPCSSCSRVNRMGSRCCIYCGQRLR